jgi:FkbM family methyltransferase
MADRASTALQNKSRVAAMAEQVRDFRRFLPAVRMRVIFDVGANIGQSAMAFRAAYPRARILAFEPIRPSFEALRAACGGDAGTQCFNLALGDRPGRATMEARDTAVRNRIVARPRRQVPSAEVEMATGDSFCADRRIAGINFLKIDAEGYDLKVCEGFAGMIDRHKIDLIQVEAGMNLDNRDHVPLHDFVTFFAARGYLIFRIYDQALQARHPRLRRANVVFVSPARAEPGARRGPPPPLARL